jgi:hypothetical protein
VGHVRKSHPLLEGRSLVRFLAPGPTKGPTARKASLLGIAPRAVRFRFKTMTLRSPRQPSAWRLEKLVQAAQRTADARRRPATSVASPRAVTTQPRQQDVVALGIVNAGREREGLAPLAELPRLGLEQPTVERIDAVNLGAAIVQAGRVARGEVPPPLPRKDSLAYQILRAGAIARNEPFPE